LFRTTDAVAVACGLLKYTANNSAVIQHNVIIGIVKRAAVMAARRF
jgi:hypothetical protein